MPTGFGSALTTSIVCCPAVAIVCTKLALATPKSSDFSTVPDGLRSVTVPVSCELVPRSAAIQML